MEIEYAARSDKGIRESNDDRILIDNSILDANSKIGMTSIPTVAAVCDGCGGYLGGNIAAQSVLDLIRNEDPAMLKEEEYLSCVLDKCQKEVKKKKEEMPQYSQMCTTIAGCVFGEESILIFHSGDSRVYRHDRWGVSRMTKDHSVVQEMIDIGYLSPEEAAEHPKRNVIRRCLGGDGLPPEIYVSNVPINPGEKYLLCSDGLWESVKESEIREILDSDHTLQEMVDILINRAKEQGSDDNISVCICFRESVSTIQENESFTLD